MTVCEQLVYEQLVTVCEQLVTVYGQLVTVYEQLSGCVWVALAFSGVALTFSPPLVWS